MQPEDWQVWRSIRLAALHDAPDSFRTTHAEVAQREDSYWIDVAHRGAELPHLETYLAFRAEECVGTTFCWVEGTELGIAAMWVAPQARRAGVGSRLLEAALEFGRTRDAQRATLWVTDGNTSAERLYAEAGFTVTGTTDLLRPGSDRTVSELARQL